MHTFSDAELQTLQSELRAEGRELAKQEMGNAIDSMIQGMAPGGKYLTILHGPCGFPTFEVVALTARQLSAVRQMLCGGK